MRLFILNSKSCRVKLPLCHFYPRPPWGGRLRRQRFRQPGWQFLSTPSVGRATSTNNCLPIRFCDFYPRPPWGGRRWNSPNYCLISRFLSTPSVGRATKTRFSLNHNSSISIHALRGEGDVIRMILVAKYKYFYPRPPWGGRHVYVSFMDDDLRISIHALRGEGDLYSVRSKAGNWYFYPRPPWGGRHIAGCASVVEQTFLSTPSVGRATFQNQSNPDALKISIHALRGEGDPAAYTSLYSPSKFLSTPSVGRATKWVVWRWGKQRISIHALRGEGDRGVTTNTTGGRNFYPRPPWGGRPADQDRDRATVPISIHALRGEGDNQTNITINNNT